MLIIGAKECENIERALKSYKKKFEKTQVLRILRERKTFTKPSVLRRQTVQRAVYRQQLLNSQK